ncbi:MAG: hypothetical protein H6700_07225 [Myxococcales bacterium]|nr:hypothetical protein [Myxococcales bacterium]MCB9531540.1 hypothetical protein [Myxococcales bacterium]
MSARAAVLATDARFDAVHDVVTRCGLVLDAVTTQVFPARPEPARAVWRSPDGLTITTFRYLTNPDRRFVDATGEDAEAVVGAVERSVGALDGAALRAQLGGTDEDSAFAAAFLATGLPRAEAVAMLVAAIPTATDHVATGCVRALEIVADATVVPVLVDLRYDAARSAELRVLAAEAAATLSSRR